MFFCSPTNTMAGSNRYSPQSRLRCACPRRINKYDPCNLHCRRTKFQPVFQPVFQPPPQAPPPPPPPPPAILPSQNHDHKSLFVTGMTVMTSTLSSVLLLCIFSAIVRFCFNKRINHSRTREDIWLDEDEILPNLDNPIWYIHTVGLQQSDIDSITVFKYKKSEGLIEGTECSVCLDEFEEDESLRLLPKCSHGFHIPCIDTWLRSHQNCPLCRFPVVCETMVAQTREENDETGVQNEVGEGGTSEELDDRDTWENVSSDLDGIQATRRSVSLDLCSAIEATAKHKHGGSLDTQFEQLKYSKGKIGGKRSGRGSSSFGKLMKSTSIGRSLSKGPVLMKRSFSCGGMFLISNPTKGQGSILPL